MAKKYLVIFDLDNTLIVTKPAAKEAYQQAIFYIAKQYGLNHDRQKLYNYWKRIVQKVKNDPDPVKRVFEYSLRLLLDAKKIPDTYISQALGVYEKIFHEKLVLQAGAKELLEWLSDEGHTICLATESTNAQMKKKLKAVGLVGAFDCIITANDIGTMKPNPEYLNKIIAKYSLPKKNIVVVGDSKLHDIAPAKKLGLRAIQVPPAQFHLGVVQKKLETLFAKA
jgi:putative hydrolase of the HAD superfamily